MLTVEEKQAFKDDGFVVFDPHIEESVIDAASAATDSLLTTAAIPGAEWIMDGGASVVRREGNTVGTANPRGRVINGWRQWDCLKQIALYPTILEALFDLHGMTMRAFQTLSFKYGTQQRAHSDTIHFNSLPSGGMCGVWIALEDIGPEQGPLFYYPGSHKLPEYSALDVATPPVPGSSWVAYEDFLQGVIERERLEPASFLATKGQVGVWAANLFHGGRAVLNPEATRHSLVTHYFAAGHNVYSPTWTVAGCIHPGNWADSNGQRCAVPEWIQ